MAGKKNKTQEKSYVSYEKEKILGLAKKIRKKQRHKSDTEIVDDVKKNVAKTEISTFSMVKNVFSEAWKKSKRELKRTVGAQVLCSSLRGLSPYLGKFLYGGLADVAMRVPGAGIKTGIFAGLEAVRQSAYNFFSVKGQDNEFILTNAYLNSIRAKLYEEILSKPRPYFKKNDPGALGGIVDNVAREKADLLKRTIQCGGYALVFGLASCSMATVAPELAIAVTGVTIVTSRFGKYMNDRFRKFNNKYDSFIRRMGKENRDSISNASLVQETKRVDREVNKINSNMKRSSYIGEIVNRNRSMGNLKFGTVVNVAMQAVITAVSLYDVWETKDIGRFALINGASWQTLNSGTQLSNLWNNMQAGVQRIIDTEKKLITPHGLERIIGDKSLSKSDTKIRIENVTFAYPEINDITDKSMLGNEVEELKKGKDVLRDVSVEFDKGKLTAIIGTSGHGKSTLMNLIRHDYDVDEGKIFIGDKEIRDIKDDELNGHISFVEQKVHFFDASLEYNLKYFKTDATKEELEKAIEMAGLKEDVEKFKDKMGFNVGFDGNNLSGGQKQRLALARAFLSDKPIVIMDEPTTGLDQELSLKVMKAVKNMAKEKTVIMVTHNPTEIALVDRVVMVKDGRIVADGSPYDLISANMMGNVLTKEGVKNNEKLYDKTVNGDNPYEQINELFNDENKRSLSDLERMEKRRLLEANREAYIKARKGAMLKARVKREGR